MMHTISVVGDDRDLLAATGAGALMDGVQRPRACAQLAATSAWRACAEPWSEICPCAAGASPD